MNPFFYAKNFKTNHNVTPSGTERVKERVNEVYINSFTPKYVKFTIIWCLKSPMTLIGLNHVLFFSFSGCKKRRSTLKGRRKLVSTDIY
jgi:hypothetical protein